MVVILRGSCFLLINASPHVRKLFGPFGIVSIFIETKEAPFICSKKTGILKHVFLNNLAKHVSIVSVKK